MRTLTLSFAPPVPHPAEGFFAAVIVSAAKKARQEFAKKHVKPIGGAKNGQVREIPMQKAPKWQAWSVTGLSGYGAITRHPSLLRLRRPLLCDPFRMISEGPGASARISLIPV